MRPSSFSRLSAAGRLFLLLMAGLLAAPGVVRAQRVYDTRAGQPLPGLPFWKWQSPTPQGYTFRSLHAFSDSAVLAVGDHGLALRTADWGRTWAPVAVGTDANLMGVAFATPQVGWLIGNTSATNERQVRGLGIGEVRTTINGGATWTSQVFGEQFSVKMQKLMAHSATQAVVYYEWSQISNNGFNIPPVGRLRRTTNGGRTWTLLVNPAIPPGDACFPTPTLGFIGGGGALFRTADGGATWQDYSAATPGLSITVLTFLDAQRGWAGGARLMPGDGGPLLFKTLDGGLTWTPTPAIIPSDTRLTAVRFAADNLRGQIFDASWQRYWQTTDGGLTWGASMTTAVGNPYWPPAGRVLPSGGIWLQTADRELRLARQFPDSLRTVYTARPFTEAWLRRVVFPEPGTGWLAPAAVFTAAAFWPWDTGPQPNTLWRTTDRGDHWRALPLDSLAAGLVTWAPPGGRTFLTTSAFPDRDTAFVAGLEAQDTPQRQAFVLRSVDAGRTWQRLPLPVTPLAPLQMQFFNSQRGLIVGTGGATFLTHDGGLTWQQPVISPKHIYTCGWVDAQHAYAGGDSLNLAVSTDGGQAWRTVTWDSLAILGVLNPTPTGSPYADTRNLYFVTPQQGYRFGSTGLVELTRNGGTTWWYGRNWTTPPGVPFDGEVWANPQQVQFRTRREGYAFGPQQLRTLDGGRTWTIWAATSTPNIQTGTLIDRYNAYAVGSGGIIRYSEKFIRTDTALARTTFCLGTTADSIRVPFTTEGTFTPAEQDFRVELSNTKGRFRPGQTLLVGRGAASPLTARLPATLPAGTYRLRVIRADSTVLGVDNGVDLLVTRQPAAVAVAPADSVSFCAGDSAQLTAPAGFGRYRWTTGATTRTVWVRAAGTYAVQVGGAPDCLSPVSDSVRVRVRAVPAQATITAAPQPSGIVVLTSSAATGNQWFLNGAPIAGATGTSYTASTSAQNGAYTVQVTQRSCIGPVSAAVAIGITGTAEEAAAAQLTVSPNPAHGYVVVRAASGLLTVCLTDLSGREVARATGTGAELTVPLTGVAAGTYLLRAGVRGGGTAVRRLLVE